jgi:hypothetical protein
LNITFFADLFLNIASQHRIVALLRSDSEYAGVHQNRVGEVLMMMFLAGVATTFGISLITCLVMCWTAPVLDQHD